MLLPLAALAFVVSAQSVRTADKAKDPPPALEKKLHGDWEADDMDCVGELTLRADGTFERRHYSPGNNTLTGTWEMRWNALPPTLVLTCKISYYSGDVTKPAADDIGKVAEVKVIQLDNEVLALQWVESKRAIRTERYKRIKK
jgi:hypothetical protein